MCFMVVVEIFLKIHREFFQFLLPFYRLITEIFQGPLLFRRLILEIKSPWTLNGRFLHQNYLAMKHVSCLKKGHHFRDFADKKYSLRITTPGSRSTGHS